MQPREWKELLKVVYFWWFTFSAQPALADSAEDEGKKWVKFIYLKKFSAKNVAFRIFFTFLDESAGSVSDTTRLCDIVVAHGQSRDQTKLHYVVV